MDEFMNDVIPIEKNENSFADNDTRLRILYLYQMLLTQSDEEHPLSTKQITDRMMEQHHILVHRTTVPKDIDLCVVR